MNITHPFSAVLCLSFALVACSSTAGPGSSGSGGGDDVTHTVTGVTDTAKATAAGVPFGNALREIDGRVAQFVNLQTEPGEEARRERDLVKSALSAQVAQYLDPLILSATDPTSGGRQVVATKALAFSDDPRATDALVGLLDPKKSNLRLLTAATFSLSRNARASTATQPLLDLVTSPDLDVKNNTLMALWHVFDARRRAGASPLDPISHERALPMLKTALYEPDDAHVRAYAAAALGALGDKRSTEVLVERLQDTHPLVRVHTALALGKIGDVSAVLPLVRILDETPRGTPKRAVVMALRLILEQHGRDVPDHIGDSERRWEAFVHERYGPPGEPVGDLPKHVKVLRSGRGSH